MRLTAHRIAGSTALKSALDDSRGVIAARFVAVRLSLLLHAWPAKLLSQLAQASAAPVH
jgi:hypothetical protein